MSNTIVVFGGTGKTGSEATFQALKNGYKVVVLARDPSKMLIPLGSGKENGGKPLIDKNLKVVQGSVTDPTAVDRLFEAEPDVAGVIVALGGKTKNVGPTMLTDGTRNIISSMKKYSKAKRIAVVTSIGAGDSENQAPLMFKALMYTVMKGIFADKNNQEKLFIASDGPGHDLEWLVNIVWYSMNSYIYKYFIHTYSGALFDLEG
jgi:nucleoside-diphosphate-sugar epimerase